MAKALTRRSVMAGCAALAMATNTGAAAPWPTISPADAGFVPDLAERLDAGFRSGLLKNTHAVVITRHGKLVAEKYFTGKDENWGAPLGEVTHGPETLHDLRSVSKSIVALLYGIALDRKLVAAPDASLLAQFPEHADLAKDATRASWTIQHVLDMALGVEWREGFDYRDPSNDEIRMEMSPQRVRYVLERPIKEAPGKRFIYSGGCTALIGHLIEKGSGKPLPEFAREALFQPLGIEKFEWAKGADGIASAASGLRLSARDLARIGTVIVTNGTVAGKLMVPGSWIATLRKPALPTGDGLEYGHFFFHGDILPMFKGQPKWLAGFGNGGQRLWISPDAGIVVVHYSGAYNQGDSWITPNRLWREMVLANMQANLVQK